MFEPSRGINISDRCGMGKMNDKLLESRYWSKGGKLTEDENKYIYIYVILSGNAEIASSRYSPCAQSLACGNQTRGLS